MHQLVNKKLNQLMEFCVGFIRDRSNVYFVKESHVLNSLHIYTSQIIIIIIIIILLLTYLLTYLLACLLTPWCRILLEKLPGLQLVKNFPAFYGTRKFITALIIVRQLSLSWASPIQSI